MRLLFSLLICLGAGFWAQADQVDVLVYGATPAGIAAALAAAGDGDKVLLVEPTSRIGGMMTNGLSQADFLTFESLSGPYLRFAKRVEEAYRPEFGAEAGEVSMRGTHAEPKVNLAVFEAMLAEQPRLTLRQNWALEGAECSTDANGDAPGAMRALEMVVFAEPNGERHTVAARYFIDATYEGDLMAAAGVPYAVGREGSAEFHESLAPPEPDHELQAYNLRLCMTQVPANRVAPRPPGNYRREDFTSLLPLLEDGRVGGVFGKESDRIFRAPLPELPHGKHDINDMADGPVRISLPGANDAWPDGGGGVAIRGGATDAIERPPFSRLALLTARQRIVEEHRHWTIGLLYFLQHDEAVPERFRHEAQEWGWCRDEFPENGHVPEQLYVREARRLVGQYIFTQNDTAPTPDDDRTPPHRDSVAIGEYGPLCLGTGQEGPAIGGKRTGAFHGIAAPYQVPFGVMVPRNTENLLVTCAVSASHVGFCALRFEPTWMSLGEAAGHAAHLARQTSHTFQDLPVSGVQEKLRAAGAATIYMSDVPSEHPLFAAVQWWGNAGGWNGVKQGENGTELGPVIVGEYREAFRHHAAALDRKLEPAEIERWAKLAERAGVPREKLPPATPEITRGDWLKAAYAAAGK